MFSQITMAVPDPNLTAQFYCDSLGMSKQRHGLGYDPAQAHLKFLSGPSVYLQKGGFYWKIGLTVPDLDRSVLHLKSQGVSVSQPRQFENIVYMAHILDPAGCTIELLQQGLQAPAAPKAPVDKLAQDAGHPVAAGAILAHVTVRVRNLGLAQNWWAEQGLYLLSVQPLSDTNPT
jgi:catechol 2,3-dioxygenase-like lactoylglutathione lyase family enzyme